MIPKKYPITCHTKHIKKESVFVAIKGFKQDGTKYIEKAISLGAKKIVIDKNQKNILTHLEKYKDKIEFIFTNNTRKYLAKQSSLILKKPSSKLKIIGITGTKGKTTTTYLIEHILKNSGFKTALLGTIKNKILNKEEESINTTPESDYIHMFFNECVKNNIDYVVMEVSSHSLSLHRTFGIKFDAIGFTNLAAEHLDFYKDMENYFNAKSILFNQVKLNGTIVLNTDDNWGKKAFNNLNPKFEKLNLISLNKKTLKNNFNNQNLYGEFNKYNLTMAYLICQKLGIDKEKIDNAIKNFTGVPGRMQLHVLKNECKAFVDYAHNPSSMEAILKTLKPLTKNLIIVFGCGGDRDKTKRPVMGKIATRYANQIIISDDNPRTEDPKKIIDEILMGIEKQYLNKTFCFLDRKKAIEKAAKISDNNSIIAILGKGHENYYLVNDKKFHFDDFEEISKF